MASSEANATGDQHHRGQNRAVNHWAWAGGIGGTLAAISINAATIVPTFERGMTTVANASADMDVWRMATALACVSVPVLAIVGAVGGGIVGRFVFGGGRRTRINHD